MSLVLDVQLKIISQFLEKPELLSLATVSRHYNHIVTPLIYRCISLRLRISQVAIQRTPQRDDHDALQAAQTKLLNTLAARPELARHTRTLEWQIQPVYKGEFTGAMRWMDLTEQQESELDHIYNTFLHMFCNVTKVYLVPSTSYITAPFPKALFPSVTSVKLTNYISPEMVRSILHSPTQISELSLDTIDSDVYVEIVQWLAATSFPGLRRLSLRYGPVAKITCNSEFETELFSAWGRFLRSSHRTLREILLGFRHSVPGCNVYTLSSGVVPYPEGRLARIVAPIFSEVTWPELRVVELEGVSSYPGLWESLEASVPRLLVDDEERWIVQCWDSKVAAKF